MSRSTLLSTRTGLTALHASKPLSVPYLAGCWRDRANGQRVPSTLRPAPHFSDTYAVADALKLHLRFGQQAKRLTQSKWNCNLTFGSNPHLLDSYASCSYGKPIPKSTFRERWASSNRPWCSRPPLITLEKVETMASRARRSGEHAGGFK
jgi:hypothetical protein